MKQSKEELKARFERAMKHKDEWRTIYEDAYKYVLPQRNLYGADPEMSSPKQDKMARVYDSTAISSTQKFANRLQAGIFPIQRQWCRLVPGQEIPEERRVEVQRILDDYTDKMFDVMRQSNFDMAMGELLLELAIGTGSMLIQKGSETSPIRYTAIPQALIAFDEGPHGTVDKVYRKHIIPFENISREFPDAKIPSELQETYSSKRHEKIELMEITCYDDEEGVYHYHLLDKSGDHEIVYRRMNSFAWIVSRYMTAAGEKYGRGPVLSCIHDIKSLNTLKEYFFKNASLSIAGVYTASDDGILNPSSIRLVPGAIIPVASNGGNRGPSLQPLPRSGDPQLSQISSQDLIASIKSILMDESLPPDTMSARSATEIAERMRQLSQNLGSSFGRLINEIMYPVVRRTLELMDEMGMIELPLSINGLQVKVIPVAPIAMSQNMEKLGEIMQYVQISQQMGPIGQIAIKQEKLLDYIADQLAIPAEIRTTPEERQEIQQMMMEQAQQVAAQQQQGVMDGGQGTGEGNQIN
jgi:hypothetical protein